IRLTASAEALGHSPECFAPTRLSDLARAPNPCYISLHEYVSGGKVMTGAPSGPVVDADGHVLEPADTWLTYIDPQYRDRAIRIAYDDEGYENLLIDNKPLHLVRGHLGVLGGIGMDPEALHTDGKMTYADG